jgi:hypothetical protein
MAVGDDLEAIVTYDDRMLDAARLAGLSTATPRWPAHGTGGGRSGPGQTSQPT